MYISNNFLEYFEVLSICCYFTAVIHSYVIISVLQLHFFSDVHVRVRAPTIFGPLGASSGHEPGQVSHPGAELQRHRLPVF